MQVNILEAKNRLSQLIQVVLGGGEVVIANRGQPVARLVAVPPPLPGLPPGDVGAWLDRRPLPRHARRSAADIDAALALEGTAWD